MIQPGSPAFSARLLHSVALAALLGLGGMAAAQAQDDAPAARKHHRLHLAEAGDAHPLTVHRRAHLPLPDVTGDGVYDAGYDEWAYGEPGFIRSWNDPRLDRVWGFRFGGDNFYGDEDGAPITRGNAGLSAISGYGPARGGYGGPHFDSVGGFHNGPGPGAQEAADYATGNISTPVYDRPLPHYPSLKTQVAELDTGIGGTGQVHRTPSTRERWAALYRAGAEEGRLRGAEPVAFGPDF